MTAATGRIQRVTQGDAFKATRNYGVKANEIIKAGWICMLDENGYLVKGTSATAQKSAGIAMADVDATGVSSGVKTLDVQEGIVSLKMGASADAIVLADLFVRDALFCVDNQTVACVATSRSPCGVLFGLNPEFTGEVYALVGALARRLLEGKSIQSGRATLSSGVATITGVTITARSRIVATIADAAGTLGTGQLSVKDADRTVGPPSTGQFKVTSLKEDKTTETSDTSTIDWIVVND